MKSPRLPYGFLINTMPPERDRGRLSPMVILFVMGAESALLGAFLKGVRPSHESVLKCRPVLFHGLKHKFAICFNLRRHVLNCKTILLHSLKNDVTVRLEF